ncbi:MAG TPA: M23 family metallopeptidase [Kofleriaceae bacterium]|nr:M23 family metallopeptidase [Kofleriaceae bacterium]
MSTLPWLLGGGAVAIGAYLSTRREAAPGDGALPGRWVWPVGAWRNRKPEISDGFTSPRHTPRGELIRHGGVDIMYRRAGGDLCPPGTPNGSRGYIMPDHRAALAASDGAASFAASTPRGWTVILDHTGKLATYYTHLSQLLVVPKQRVRAGQPLGIIGGDPLDAAHLMHLHFEIWHGGAKGRFDPEPLMRSWEYLPDPGDLPATFVARNATTLHRLGGGGPIVVHASRGPWRPLTSMETEHVDGE